MAEFYFTPRGTCVDLVERTPDPAGRRDTRLVTTFTIDEARSIAATLSASIATAEDAMKATRARRHAEREEAIRAKRAELAELEREHEQEQRELAGAKRKRRQGIRVIS